MGQPFITCAVIVNDQHHYLLIKRAREPYMGQWAFISGIGASKKGLPPEQAVINEVVHDIGTSFSGELAFSYPLANADLANTAHVFVGKVSPAAITLNPKAAAEYKWFSSQELQQQNNLAFEDKWIFEQIMEK